jgi:hypothetical protein
MKTSCFRFPPLLLLIVCLSLQGCIALLETLSPPSPSLKYSFWTEYPGYNERTNITTFVSETRRLSYSRPLLGSLLAGSSRGEVRLMVYSACPGRATSVNQCPASNVRVEFRHYNTSDTQCTYLIGQKMPVRLTLINGGTTSRASYAPLDYDLYTADNRSEVTETNRFSCELSEIYAWVMDRDAFLTFAEAEAAWVSFGSFDYDLAGHNRELITFRSR